jgi:hypothetical protein
MKNEIIVSDVINKETKRPAISKNYAINESMQHIWQLNKHDAEIVNEGFRNGKTNISLIVCMYCRSAIASHELNEFYYCHKCFKRKIKK